MSPRRRLLLLGMLVVTAFVAVLLTVGHHTGGLRHLVDGLGAAGPPVFVVLMAALTCALFPFPLLAAAAGVLFGTAGGTAVSIAGGTLGATCAFLIARHGGQRAVEELLGGRFAGLREATERRGFVTVLYLRIFPGVPRDVANYALGLTRVRLEAYVLATLIGISPRAFAYTALGGSFRHLRSPEAVVAVALLVAMGALGLFLVRRDAQARRAVRE